MNNPIECPPRCAPLTPTVFEKSSPSSSASLAQTPHMSNYVCVKREKL